MAEAEHDSSPHVGSTSASGRAGARAYAAARRHSSHVRFFRRAIPVGAVIGIGFILVIALFDPFNRIGGLTLGPISLSGTKITMESPRLSGYRKDSRAYEVTAAAALQDVRKPTVIELKSLSARLTLDDAGNTARLEAATGVFDTQKELLQVRQDVRVKTSNGQEADLNAASIDFKAGTVSTNEGVKIRLPDATVEADALDVRDNGKVISFVGNVKTVLNTTPIARSPSPDASSSAGPVAARTSQAEPASLRP